MASGYMFSHYWPGDGLVGEIPEDPADPYPQRQGSIMMTYGGLIPPVWLSIPWTKLWTVAVMLFKVYKLVMSPEFEKARQIVREVAVTPDMNNGKAWGVIGNYMGKQPGVGENVYRHLLASQKWGPEHCGTRHTRDTMLQLAYLEFKKERS